MDQVAGVSGALGMSGAGNLISGIGDLGVATADIIAATKGNALPNTTSPTAVQQPKPSTAATGSNRTWWIIGSVLVLGVVIAGVVYLFKSKKESK